MSFILASQAEVAFFHKLSDFFFSFRKALFSLDSSKGFSNTVVSSYKAVVDFL